MSFYFEMVTPHQHSNSSYMYCGTDFFMQNVILLETLPVPGSTGTHIRTSQSSFVFVCRQIKQVWKEAPLEGGKLDYLKFVAIIKRGKDDD